MDAVLAVGPAHRETLLAAGSAAVPPGVAYRVALARNQRRTSPEQPYTPRGDAVSSGAREYARWALAAAIKWGTYVRDGDEFRLAHR